MIFEGLEIDFFGHVKIRSFEHFRMLLFDLRTSPEAHATA